MYQLNLLCFANILGILRYISLKGPFSIRLSLGMQSPVFSRLFFSRPSRLFWAMLWATKLCVIIEIRSASTHRLRGESTGPRRGISI